MGIPGRGIIHLLPDANGHRQRNIDLLAYPRRIPQKFQRKSANPGAVQRGRMAASQSGNLATNLNDPTLPGPMQSQPVLVRLIVATLLAKQNQELITEDSSVSAKNGCRPTVRPDPIAV